MVGDFIQRAEGNKQGVVGREILDLGMMPHQVQKPARWKI